MEAIHGLGGVDDGDVWVLGREFVEVLGPLLGVEFVDDAVERALLV